MTKEVTTTEEATISKYAEPESPQSFRIKEIRLSVPLTKVDVPAGQYYIWDPNVPEGQDPELTPIGEAIKVKVLRDAKIVALYDSNESRTMYKSSEFRAWTDEVVLFDYTQENTTIKAILPYNNPAGGKSMKDLKNELGMKMKYVTYLLYKGEIYRMNITNTDMFGADKNYKPMIESPDDKSFDVCKNKHCYAKTPNQMFGHDIEVSSKTISPSSKDRVKTFEAVGQTGGEYVTAALDDLYAMLAAQLKRRMERAVENTDMEQVEFVNSSIITQILEDQEPLLNVGTTKYVLTTADAIDVPSTPSRALPQGAPEAAKVDQVVADLEGKKSGRKTSA